MNRLFVICFVLVGLVMLTGCPMQESRVERARRLKKEQAKKVAAAKKADPDKAKSASKPAAKPAPKPAVKPVTKPAPPKPAEPAPTANQADVDAVIAKTKEFGSETNTYKLSSTGALTQLTIKTELLTIDDVKLIAKLSDLVDLAFLDCRAAFNDDCTRELEPLKDKLVSLRIGNATITNASLEIISEFPNIETLILNHDVGINDEGAAFLTKMEKLKNLNMIYTNLTDSGMISVRMIPNLKSLDIRGCTIISDTGLRTLARRGQVKLTSFQHSGNAVTDTGIESLTQIETLENLHLQDFSLSDQAGEWLKKFKNLKSLVVFRCGEFGSQGLLQLKGLPLNRLTIRGLDKIGDDGMDVFSELPNLKRLYLVEMYGITDAGIGKIAAAKSIELLEIEMMSDISNESLKAIATLPNLKELKLKATSITNDGLDTILGMPKLTKLSLLDNDKIDSKAAEEKLKSKKFELLNIGKTRGEVEE